MQTQPDFSISISTDSNLYYILVFITLQEVGRLWDRVATCTLNKTPTAGGSNIHQISKVFE